MNEEEARKPLRRGYTTGSCAAAAAKGAALALMTGVEIHRIGITLPGGTPVVLPAKLLSRTEDSAACVVVKDGGDDPDVTNGAAIVGKITMRPVEGKEEGFDLSIVGGEGVGQVTKPGLPVTVGNPAINPVPRSMIETEVSDVLINFAGVSNGKAFEVTIEVPEGESLAERTLNPRLGIVDGISILGTTGIVEPISTRAWEETIAVQVDVALACGCETVVLTPGRSSEKAAGRLYPELPEEAFIQMGDYVESSVRRCAAKGVAKVIVVAMPGKMVKIAMGFPETHHLASQIDFDQFASWAQILGMDDKTVTKIRKANTVREVAGFLPGDSPLYREILHRALESLKKYGEGKIGVEAVLVDYRGEVLQVRKWSRGKV
ncbi:MAG: cobalt-precorrin-5B (C(1))-methyltransferase [Deltaproteobacteria bacterium]|nr:cobalt-precorrin-5B (C(1))-methyltransferase [Deltaproteobacteria bacterium]